MRAWEETEPPLRRYLASLGATRSEIDDLVQETAARSLEKAAPFAEAAQLRRWSFVVARRLRIDALRQLSRLGELDTETPDLQAADLMGQVEDRHLLLTVQREYLKLTVPHQRALSHDAATLVDGRERNRAAVARHRARRKLRDAVGPLAAAVGLVSGSRRSFALPAVRAAAAVTPLLLTLLLIQPWSDGRAQQPRPAPRTQAPLIHLTAERAIDPAADWRYPERETSLRQPPAARSQDSGPPGRTVLRAAGPNRTEVYVRVEPNNADRPLVCIDPGVGQPVCVAKPDR
jgi:DNA-directed RNA polymerase specialized sigma24 family protein